MTTNLENQLMQELERLVKKSLDQYQTILNHIEELQKILGRCPTKELKSYCEQLQSLQDTARQIDSEIDRCMQDVDIDVNMTSLLHKRQKMMQDIIRHNDLLFPEISGKLAVISAELSQTRAGKTAISGYKVAHIKKGRIVNSLN
jgi:DNA repair ATPase RecN